MSRHRIVLAALASVALVAVAPEANGGGGTPITTCAQVVTTNAFLTQDLYCPGQNGVNFGADGITIDLKVVHPAWRPRTLQRDLRRRWSQRGDGQERSCTRLR